MAAPLNPTPASLAEDAVVKPPRSDHNIETPSGKWSGGENFPVGSWLLPARLRPHVMAFYGFARAADGVPSGSPQKAGRRKRVRARIIVQVRGS